MTDPLKQHPKTSFKDISPFSSLGSLSYRSSPTLTLKRFLPHILKTHMSQFLQAGINSFYGNIPFGNTPGTCMPFASSLEFRHRFPLDHCSMHPLSFTSLLNEPSWEQTSKHHWLSSPSDIFHCCTVSCLVLAPVVGTYVNSIGAAKRTTTLSNTAFSIAVYLSNQK